MISAHSRTRSSASKYRPSKSESAWIQVCLRHGAPELEAALQLCSGRPAGPRWCPPRANGNVPDRVAHRTWRRVVRVTHRAEVEIRHHEYRSPMLRGCMGREMHQHRCLVVSLSGESIQPAAIPALTPRMIECHYIHPGLVPSPEPAPCSVYCASCALCVPAMREAI